MNLTGIVTVTGKPGIHRVLSQNKSGFVIESLGDKKVRSMIDTQARVALLTDITLYGIEDDIKLIDIFERMNQDLAGIPDPKSSDQVLKDYFTTVIPQHDPSRVYPSDIKKVVSWVKTLSVLPLWTAEPVQGS